MHSYKKYIHIIIFMSFRLENTKTIYNTMKKDFLAVVQYLKEVKPLVIGNKCSTKFYKDHSTLESIFSQGLDA